MKIGRLNRASFAKTARRAMFLFAFAVLGTQAATVAMVDGTGYETLEAAIAAAEPVDGVVTYEICGKAEVSATGWIQVLKSGLSNVKKVAFVGTTEDAEICIAGGLAILADQQYDIDVSFRNLKLSKPNPEYGGDYGHSTNYFTTWLRNTGAAENTVTYENCTFPNGACNNQYGKTVYTNCTFANGTTGLYNLWIYGGSVEMDGGEFTGTRGMKVYTEGTPATAPSVEVKGTAFSGLTEKAAIVVSKAAKVEFAEISVADCQKGLFQKDIEGSSDDQKVTVTANGSKISGSFAITANKEPETAKTEFNITGGMFTAEVPSDYCADGFTVKATTDADGNTVYGVVEKTELVNYVTLELVFGDNVADEDVVAAKALYAQEKYETCKAANEAYMALFGVTWGKGYLDVTDNTAPLYKYAGRSGSVSEVRFYIHGTLAGFTSLQSSGNQIDCTVGGNHQISRTSYSIIGVDGADGKAKLTDGNVQAYVAGGYASMFTASGKLTIDNIEFTSTTSTTVGASATRATESDTENEVASAEMEIKNCTFRGRLYVYDNFENQGKMTYSIHNCVFDGSNYSGDSNAYAIFAQCKGGNNLVIKDNAIAGFARGINIDHANVHATIEGNTISVTDTGRSCIQLSSLATANIVGNTLELTGGNAITLHEKLLTLGVVPVVSISGNTVTGTGYLIYDDAKANDKEFTSDNLKLTYATDNTVAATVDTTQGVKGSTAYITSTAVNNEVQHYVAQVGTTGYTTLAAAFAALSAENHTLTLLNENAWDAATPVYWAAGAQSGYAATLTDALTAAYKANAGAITIVCRPGADVGTMTHGHVADDLTIYGNDAYLSGGECDLEVDTYTFSRATGAQAAGGVYLDGDITITAYELDNLGVWGERHTAYTVTVNLTDCDSKALEGKTNLQRVYISGTTGVNDITLTDCDFLTKATAVYSNADGAIKAVNCSFTGGQVPFNINHKANGTQTVAVENCTFTNCGDAGDWKQFAAPLRLVNSGTGTQSAEVTGCAFAGTVGANGDILLGDGRTGQASNDVELKVVNTAANIQAQKPGYYGVETVDATKKATATSPASGTLETSVAKLLPVDPRTLGYATSGKAEALPATPDMNGEVVNVTAAQAQYVLDGAYGPIDGKTINFTESINDTLILGRASKYDGSKTVYRHGSHAGEALSYADFIAYKNQSVWTESCYYERTVENVTFTANEGVTVKNFEADGGAHIYAGTAPVYDYVRDTGSWVTEGSCYFKRAILQNITFKGLTFKAKTDINTSESTTVYDGFTFKDCTFDLGTTADGNQAIRYYNENNNGNVKNLVVDGCTFKTCSQGVYTAHVKNVTVTGSTFDTTGHNAIAIQDFKGACDHGEVVITGNTFKGIGDRIIRFNNVGLGTTVTIKDNTADGNSGKLDEATGKREIVKATTLPVNAADSIKASGNNWGANTVVEGVFIDDYATKLGTEACPYSREQFAAMTRADYIAAQKRLGGTLYVNVGDYAYEKNGVLGNGVRNDTPGQVPDHSKLNAYGENGYLGEKNDGANGQTVVFVGGTITSGVTGYTSIDNIGTSLLLAVPAYTKVTFEKTTFKNVLSFNYQLYTSPWSQLGSLTFNGCTFDGIIVGAIASQELAFNGCTFNNYENTTSANNSNPTWIRPAYGNWTKGDNEGQGTDFRSLTKITFENNTVTSTRPVKFERIAQWEMETTVTATNNTFAITPQEGDKNEKKTKNVGLYFGANAKFDLVIDKNEKRGETAALYTAEYKAPTEVTYVGLPAGSTVKNAAGEEVDTGDGDALAWKTTKKITLKTTTEVASVTNAKGVSVNFATLAEAIAAAQAGETVTLLADITLASKQSIRKELTLDLNGKTLTGTAYQTLSLGSGANVTIQDSSAEKTGKVANGYKGSADPYTICLDGYDAAALTLVSGTVEANPHKTDLQSVAINTNYKKDGPYAINIRGGKVFVPESSTNGRAIVAGENVTLTVEGGEIVGGLHGVDVYGGSTTVITGGSISARVVDTGVIEAAYGLRAKGTASVTIGAADGTADAVSVAGIKMDDDGYKLNVPVVTVNSGTIAGPVYSITKGTIGFTVQATSEDVLRFADDTAAKFLPSNLELRAKDIDGKTMYYVAAKPVAAIGAIGYATLADAIAAAKDGETVKLLADVNGDGIAIAPNTFKTGLTVDFGGHTYTVGGLLVGSSGTASNGFQLNAGNRITFKNGAIVGATATAGAGTDWKGAPAILIQNYCDLTLEQMTVKGGDETCYTLSNNNGEIVIDGSTIVAGKGTKYGPFAFDVCRYANYPSVHVTVKGASVIEGNVEISGTIGDNQSRQLDIEGVTFKGAFKVVNQPANIAISGGTFATAIDETYCAAGFIPTKNADGTYGVKKGAYVAQVGTTKYDTVDAAMEAAAASETATTVNLISESEDATLVPTWFIKNDVTIDADSAVTATFAPVENADDAPDTDGMAYLASFDAKSTRTVTVGENVTLSFPNTAVKKGALYFGYGSDGNWAPMNMMINGRVEAYLPYLGAQSTMTISKTGSLKALAENLITRWGSTMTVTGTDGAWTATKPQVSLGYASQQGGEVTFKDTFVKAGSWWQMWNRNGRDDYATKLTLDNTSFVADAFKGSVKDGGTTSAYEVELKNSSRMTISGDFGVIAEGSVTIEAGSLIIAKSIDNAGTFIVDATGITAPVKVFDYTGTVEMTLADYGAVNVVGGEAYVEDGDLWVRELPVAKIGETVYGSLADAVVAAQGGDTVTLLTDVALTEALTLDKDLTLDLGGKTVTAGAVKTTRLSNDGCYAGFVVNGSAQVAVKNGTLTSAYATYKDGTTSASYSSYVVLVDDTAHLTLDGVCVVGQDAGDNYVCASGGICYDSTGSLTLKSCTVSAGASNGKGYNYNNPAAIFTVSGCDGTLVVDATTVTGGAATGIKMDKDGSAAINVNGGVDVTVSNGSKLVGGGSAKTAGNALEARGSGTLKVSDSTLQGGSSTDGIGGSALYVTSSTVTAEVTGATLVGGDGGTSWDGSGVVLNKAATVTITDSTVKSGRGENATGNAAAITLPNWESADLTLSNVSLSGSDRNTVIKNGLTDGIKLAGDVTVDAGTLKNVAISELGENVSIMISEGAAAEEDTIVSLDPDRALVKDSDVLFRSGMAVAQVVDSQGNKMSYATLASALAAADAGATVKMLADVVLTEKQTIAKALVLDLNGKTISSTVNQFITIAKGGDLTVNDATGEGRIENTTTEFWGGTILMTGGVLTVNGGTLAANTATGAYSPVIEAESSVTINVAGGRIEANRTGSVNAIQLGQNADATLNVTGGTIFGGKIGVYSYQCTGNVSVGNRVNVSGGEIIGKSGNAVYAAAKTGLSISGGTLTPGGTAAALAIGGGSTTASSCTVTVGREGGVVGDVTIPSIDFKPGYSANMATVNLLSGIVQKFLNFDRMTVATVSQGKDKLLVGTDITACLPGSELLCQLDAASGLYEIVKLTVENAAAIVTHNGVETLYRTVQQARTAVADDDTLTLKMDYTGSLGITKKNVTIDLGGKTLTGASNSHALSFNQSAAGDNTVTVKNGTIVAKGQDAACIRATSGDAATTLTLVLGDDLTLEVGSNNWSGKVVLDKGARTASPRTAVNNGGLLVTEDGTDWIYGETETAFTHAAGTEVTLLNDWYCTDYEGAVKVPDTSAFGSAKLNLDGHTIKHYGAGAAIVMGNDAKPSEGTAVKTLEISNGMIETSQYGAAVCGSNKSLTLDGVSVKTTGDDKLGIYANGMTSGNTVTLKNGSAVVSEKATGIYFPGAGTLTVEDSNVTGGMSGIEVRAGVLNVSGTSVIESTAAEFSFTNDDNGITATGAAVAAVKHTVGNDLAVTITSGTFKGPRGFYENDPNADKPGTVTVSISGGAFSTDVEKKYLADGCKTVQKTIDGAVYYVVGPAVTQIEVTLGDVKKLLPFADDWLTKNIDTEASGWTTAALEEKAANELAKWQCYLFGLDPNKKEAKVVATAGQGTDEAIPLTVANADASASPLVKGGYVTVAYVLMGSNDGTVWTQVATFDKRDGLAIPLTGTTYKFYRVDVTVTSAEGN